MNGELEATLERLSGRCRDWAEVGTKERASLLQACIATTERVAPEWVRLVCSAKGIDPRSPLVGEAWMAGPMPW